MARKKMPVEIVKATFSPKISVDEAKEVFTATESVKLDSKCDSCPTVEWLKGRNELLEALLFAVVRNSGVLPLGIALKKTEDEIADKTLEIIDLLKETVDIPKMTELRNKAVERRKEGNNETRKKKV